MSNSITFALAITTFNRKQYLKECCESWLQTRDESKNWILIIADDGSTDGTLEYVTNASFKNTEVIIIENDRLGIHQQTNSILKKLSELDFDFCFKIDDDITFLKKNWDNLYYETAKTTGNQHLVFCDSNWSNEQIFKHPVKKNGLVGNVDRLNVQGAFYTITPQILEKVGFMDVQSFGFRGMGHVDYTARCARAGFTNEETPWDILDSNSYISATKQDYHSVLTNSATSVYDSFNRERKEKVILQRNLIYVKNQEIDLDLYSKFKEELIDALSDKVIHFDNEKKELISWYESELKKVSNWHLSQYEHLPKWYLKLGKLFKLLKLKR